MVSTNFRGHEPSIGNFWGRARKKEFENLCSNIVGGVDIQGRSQRLFDLDYADDIVFLAESEREAQLMLDRVVLLPPVSTL